MSTTYGHQIQPRYPAAVGGATHVSFHRETHDDESCLQGLTCQWARRASRDAAVGGAQRGLRHHCGCAVVLAGGDGRDLLRVDAVEGVVGSNRRRGQRRAGSVRTAGQLHGRWVVTSCYLGDGPPAPPDAFVTN